MTSIPPGGTITGPRAIETHYAGCRFRSRLEARWAVFFDTLGIEWHYEPQGFETDAGRYLPDFYLPAMVGPSGLWPPGIWVEVKGSDGQVTEADRRRMGALITPDGPMAYGLLLLGPIPDPTGISGIIHHLVDSEPTSAADAHRQDAWHPTLREVVFQGGHYFGRPHVATVEWGMGEGVIPDEASWDGLRYSLEFPDRRSALRPARGVAEAYAAARSARFEHGETPGAA